MEEFRASKLIKEWEYKPLLRFVNEPVTSENWRRKLQEVETWQLEWQLGLEASDEAKKTPSICGVEATYEEAQQLRRSLRKKLSQLAQLCSDQEKLARESAYSPYRGGEKAWTWRKALVLPTKEICFEDAGEALNFLVESLEYEIKARDRQVRAKGKKKSPRQSNVPKVRLHVSLCAHGCDQFFLWEGNGEKKRRKFLNDEHRMAYHNSRNVERKTLLAPKYRKHNKRMNELRKSSALGRN